MGRKKGSKNKKTIEQAQQKEEIISFVPVKDLKREIRELRKLKNKMQPNSKERVELHRKIKDLKAQLVERKEVNKEKEDIIIEILKLKPQYINDINIDYNKHSLADLIKHLNRIKTRRV